jgi:hypothetical protein
MIATFDGATRIATLAPGVTTLSVKALYLDWKAWATNNPQWLPAFWLVQGNTVEGFIFTLDNGWKVRPQEANHTLAVEGTLRTSTGDYPYVPTLGGFSVNILVGSGGNIGIGITPEQVRAAVWDSPLIANSKLGSMGDWVTKRILTLKNYLALS